jgi:hypothetical protein
LDDIARPQTEAALNVNANEVSERVSIQVKRAAMRAKATFAPMSALCSSGGVVKPFARMGRDPTKENPDTCIPGGESGLWRELQGHFNG